MEEEKRKTLQRLVDRRREERKQKYVKDRAKLHSSESAIFDNSLRDDKMKVTSPAAREAKVDAYRKARRKMLGKPVEDIAGDTLDYKQLRKSMGKIGKAASKGLKMIPIIGAAAGLLGSNDASAAIPILDSAESLGPAAGSLESKLEDGTITPEEREILKKQALQSMQIK